MRAGIRSVVVFFFLLCPCMCWEQEELDLFDLVEEIGENFYELMQLDRVSILNHVIVVTLCLCRVPVPVK